MQLATSSCPNYPAAFRPNPGSGGNGADGKFAPGISAAPLQRTASAGAPVALLLLGVLTLGLAGADRAEQTCKAAATGEVDNVGSGSWNELDAPPVPGGLACRGADLDEIGTARGGDQRGRGGVTGAAGELAAGGLAEKATASSSAAMLRAM